MTTATTRIGTQGLDQLAPSIHEALRIAQQEAVRLQFREVPPELLLLGVIMQGHDGVSKVLSDLGINLQTMRAQAAQTFNIPRDVGAEGPLNSDFPLSEDALYCIDQAIYFAVSLHAPLTLPEHLLLGTLRHQRTQPFLALLLPAEGVIPAPVIESTGQNYKSAMDQLIHSRVREQTVVHFGNGRYRQILRGFERPTQLFTDIIGEDAAKRAMQEAVNFLRIPRMVRREEKNYLCGMLLVGSPRRHRTPLVKAVAGEAVVPLFTLSISALVGMLSDIAQDIMQLEDVDLSEDERTLLADGSVVQRGRRIIEYIFDQARKASPCVLLLDNIDAIDQLSTGEERQQWLHQLLVEMDRRDYHPSMVVIAATQHPDGLDLALLHPARFEQRVVLEDSAFTQTRPCPSCKHTTQPGWKHCMYCGTFLVKVCPHCNVLLPEIDGAHFCFECGSPLK
jgi:ATPase family associated with various cellular activities (AAA)/Double zinc ribbon/Clp amino terminal domain, pathogenicity island component